MAKTIWKFPLPDTGALMMPVGAKIISVQAQKNIGCIWALVEDSAPKESRIFWIAGTGHDLDDAMLASSVYIGTYQDNRHGNFVWHVFEYKAP